MKKLIIAVTLAALASVTKLSAQSLEQIKIAADAGDPAAEDKLAEQFIMRTDTAQAETWYRKSAAQGYAHAQGQLGNMLLMRTRMSIGLKPDARASIGAEAVKWMTLAANQGDKQGQANLADVYLEGKLVKQDFIEAYKWGELATQGGGLVNIPGIMGRSKRDAAILKMNADQIADAKRQVAEFQPHAPSKSELPTPGWIKEIKLNGISGGPTKRFATIGKETFEKGESGTVKINGKQVGIQCLDITDSSATISVEGIDGTLTLQLN